MSQLSRCQPDSATSLEITRGGCQEEQENRLIAALYLNLNAPSCFPSRLYIFDTPLILFGPPNPFPSCFFYRTAPFPFFVSSKTLQDGMVTGCFVYANKVVRTEPSLTDRVTVHGPGWHFDVTAPIV